MTLESDLRSIAPTVFPGDDAYDSARCVWNGIIDRRPSAIIWCGSADEVSKVVRICREANVPMTVRAGGHNVAGRSVADESVMLDLGRMRSVSIANTGDRVRVAGGARWSDVDHSLSKEGLATTGGLVSTTGVGGLTLGGGVGWLMRRHGLACHNLLEATVVMHDGSIRQVSDKTDPDLIWALRGAGANFGVTTDLVLAAHRQSAVRSGEVLFALSDAVGVLAAYREAALVLPRSITVFVTIRHQEPWGLVLSLAATESLPGGSPPTALTALLDSAPALQRTIARRSYVETQTMFDAAFPAGRRSYWRSAFVDGLPDGLLHCLVRSASTASSSLSTIDIEPMGGVLPELATIAAFPHSEAAFNLLVLTMWECPDEDEVHIAWANEVFDAIRPYVKPAHYVNYLADAATPGEVAAAYGESQARLARLKQIHDPDAVFSSFHPIAPGGVT